MGIFSGLKKTVASWTIGIFGVTDTFAASEPEEVADVFTCIKILTENVSKMTPQVRSEDNKVVPHRLNDILGWKPNFFQNSQAFWQTVEYTRNVYGNSYVFLQRNGAGYVTKMYALSNSSILSLSVNKYGRLFYEVDFGQTAACPMGDKRTVSSGDMLHFKHQSRDGLIGISPLVSLSSYSAILDNASSMLESFYANNAMSTLALKPSLSKAAVANKMGEATEDFINNHGSDQSGKIITLPPNTDLVQINQKYSDAQVIETQRYSKEQIGNMFGIPKFMLGITDTDQSIEQQTKQFLALTLSPILEMYSREMEFKMIRDDEHIKGLYIGYDTEKMIETDTKTKAEVMSLLVTKGLMTPNEGAIEMGNDPINSEWGNMHYTQSQNIPYERYGEYAKTNNEINNEEPKEDKLETDRDTT